MTRPWKICTILSGMPSVWMLRLSGRVPQRLVHPRAAPSGSDLSSSKSRVPKTRNGDSPVRKVRTGASGPKGVRAAPLYRFSFEGMECDGAGNFCKPRLAPRRIRQIDCCAEDDVAGVSPWINNDCSHPFLPSNFPPTDVIDPNQCQMTNHEQN